MNNAEIKMDRIRMAKRFFQENGMKVFQKDIYSVTPHFFNIQSDDGHPFDHRIIYSILMKNGDRFEILRETVDANGEFSTGSARMITREIRKVEA